MPLRCSSVVEPSSHSSRKNAIIAVTKSAYATFHAPPWCGEPSWTTTFLTITGAASLRPCGSVATSATPQAVEQFRQPRPHGFAEARAGALDHQGLRVPVQAGDDHLLDRVKYLFVLLQHLLQA